MKTNDLKILKENIKQNINESSILSSETHMILAKKNENYSKQLKKCDELKEKLIKYYREILSEYNSQLENNISEKDLKILYTYAEGIRVHINLQQDDCNQLNYQIQRKQYKCSMIVAGAALFITVFFSVLALLDIKCPLNKTVPPQCECKCDTTKNN